MALYAPNTSSFSFLVYLCLSVSFMLSVNALSFRLIHRDSMHSPLFSGRNLSDTEILQRGIDTSRARMSYLRSMISEAANNSIHPDGIAPTIGNDEFIYLVEIAFGTPSKIQFLVMDTGSHVTWIQCEPCINCYPQAYEIFIPTKSNTYSKLPCSHPLCRGIGFSCSGDDCVYQFTYGTPSTTKGVLSSETITTASSSHNIETVPNIAFGCSNDNIDFPYDDSNQIAGILGLGYGDTSMLSQLGPNAMGRFSYCLQDFRAGLHSYLKFGTDAVISGQFQHTPLIRFPALWARIIYTGSGEKADNIDIIRRRYGQNPPYFLHLDDISIGHHRMAFPPGMFDVQSDGTGGTIIDSGSALGWLHPFAYSKICDILEHYFEQYNLERYYGYAEDMDLCYVYKADMTDYPSMTYHLEDADLVMPPKNIFFISPEEGYFCFAMYSTNHHTIVGAFQQQNMRFVFDVANSQLLFAPEDCSKDT